MCVFLTRTCKGGSPPPPLQSRLPAENRPFGEAAPYSLRPRVGHDNASLYCHALAPLTRPIPGPRPFGANASRCSKMLPAFLSLRCAPACGETARPIFFSRSKTTCLTVFIFSRAGKQHASAIVTAIQRWVRIRLPTLQRHRAFDCVGRVNNVHPPSRTHFPRQIAPKPASGSQESSE